MEKLLSRLLNYKWIILVAVLLVTGYFMMEIKKNTRMETNLDKYMPQDHPAFIYSDKAEKWFDIKDGIIMAIENKDGVFNTETLDTLKQLTRRLQKMPQIDKSDVTSLYTADNIVGTGDGLDVKCFFKRVPKTKEKLEQLKKNVESNEMIFGRLVSTDETVAIIIAEIGDSVFTQDFYNTLLQMARASENDHLKIYVAGRPIVEGTLALLGPADMKRMVPIVLLVIFLVLLFTLRSMKATLTTLLVVFFSTIWAFGLMAAVNIPVYAVSTMIPVMLIAIGVAYGIHLYSHLKMFINKHPDVGRRQAVEDMLSVMWKPVVMTSVTTAVGFISLLTSQVYPVKYFGLFTAFGVTVAMVLSLVFLPAIIMIGGLPKVRKTNTSGEDNGSSWASHFTEWVIDHKYVSIIGSILVVAVSIAGLQKIWINSSFLDKFEKDSNIVQTDHFINEHFGGTSTLNLILDADTLRDAFKEPAVLKLVDRMQQEVTGSLPVVGNSFSLADFIKRMNKVMHADTAKYDRIPDDKNLIAQYLLLYEMSGDPENLVRVSDYNYEKANVTFQLKSDDSKAIKSAIAVIDKYKDDFKKLGITINYAGSGYKALVFTDLILEGQIKSLILSLFIIIFLLAGMFRSLWAGVIGSVPIIITALISFGVMGFLGIPLNTTTALLSSIAMGIGIDYAVHFIEQYRLNIAVTRDKLKAAQHAMAHSGKAIIYNAFVVISGFMVLLFSVFPPNRELGALVSLNMFTSFVGTLTIMLVLLYTTNIFFKKNKPNV